MRPICANKLGIGGNAIQQHLVLVDKKGCVGSFDAVADALGEATEFIGGGLEPSIPCDWISDELLVLHGVTCCWM